MAPFRGLPHTTGSAGGSDWLCLAPSYPGGLSRPPAPLAGHSGQIGFVWRICPLVPRIVPQIPQIETTPAAPLRVGEGHEKHEEEKKMSLSSVSFIPSCPSSTSWFHAFKSQLRGAPPQGRGVPLPRGRVARIVPEFCARAASKNRATPCAGRNKEFLARGVFYLLNCCTNMVVGRVGYAHHHTVNRELLFNHG